MSYAITPVDGAYTNTDLAADYPATYSFVLMSAWFEMKADLSGFQMIAENTVSGSDASNGVAILLDSPLTGGAALTITVGNGVLQSGGTQQAFGFISWDASGLETGVYYNILVSVDGPGNVAQAYINDAVLPPTESTWFTSSTITRPTGQASNPLAILANENFLGTNPCVADAFWDTPSGFFDLDDEANRRKFINADGSPVFLGDNGQIPLGHSPLIYLSVPTGGVATDFNINRGSLGGNFNGSGTLCIPGPTPTPTPTPAPAPIPKFEIGNWRGAVGINWKGMALVGDAFAGMIGLSDFDSFTEYGNAMEFLVTSPNVQKDRLRVFIRLFEVDVQSGVGDTTGPASDPQLLLDFSKDGGMTWQPQLMARSMGKTGEYRRRLRWISLGSSRTWVMRLRCSDPVRRVIIGTFIDTGIGTG